MAVALLAMPCAARASNYRWGVTLGYGGEGVEADVSSAQFTGTLDRSESPLIMGAFVEELLSDTFALSLEHLRGASVGPFTSGASFTGLVGKWYFLGVAPSITKPVDSGSSTIFVKRYVPFLGLSTGLARADIERDEVVPTVSGSGLYFGFRMGADYALAPGRGIRPELAYATTSFSSSLSTSATTPPLLTMFSLQVSWYFDF